MKERILKSIKTSIEILNLLKNSYGNCKNIDFSRQNTFVIEVFKELYKQEYQGRGLGLGELYGRKLERCTITSNGKYNFSDVDEIKPHSLDWLYAFIVLCDFENLTNAEIFEYAEQIKDDIIYNHIIKHIIINCLVSNNVDEALFYIEKFRTTTIYKTTDNKDQGYLIILHYYASKGDEKNFFKYFKLAKPAINRWEIGLRKQWLVQSYCLKNSIPNSIKLCKHKNLGNKYLIEITKALSEEGEYKKLKSNLKKYKEFEIESEDIKTMFLVTAYTNALKFSKKVPNDFDTLFNSCLKIDRKVKTGDFKLVDELLFKLGLAYQNTNPFRTAQCKKAIKDTYFIKKLL